VLITLNNGKLRLTDITTNPPTVTAELTNNVGGGTIGPDGCLYMPDTNAVYKAHGPVGRVQLRADRTRRRCWR
jgi:hypothetical protein